MSFIPGISNDQIMLIVLLLGECVLLFTVTLCVVWLLKLRSRVELLEKKTRSSRKLSIALSGEEPLDDDLFGKE